MSTCAWCSRPLPGGIRNIDTDDPAAVVKYVREHHSRLCAALREAQMDDVPQDVNQAAKVMYWWVQEKVAHNPRAAMLRKQLTTTRSKTDETVTTNHQ